MRLHDLDNEITAVVKTTVTDTTWLSRRGYLDLAHEMRDEFMREWEVPTEVWNDAVDELIDYVSRKGETPEASIVWLLSIRLPDPNNPASTTPERQSS